MPFLIAVTLIIPYALIGLILFGVNNLLSKRKFLRDFSADLTESQRMVAWERSKYIYGDIWGMGSFIIAWPLLVVVVLGTKSSYFFKNKSKSNYEKAVDEYYEKYPEEKL